MMTNQTHSELDYFIVDKLSLILKNFELDDITFSFPIGKTLSIIGSSGSGKTLLLRSIAGLEKINSGTIHFKDKRLDNLDIKNRHVSFVFQNYALFPNMNSSKNIGFPLSISGKKKKIINEKILKSAEELQIHSMYLDRKIDELPEGIKQLIAIGRESIKEFDILLMDEPLSQADAKIREEMRIFIKQIIKKLNKTTILCTNEPKDALVCSDYTIVLDNGKLIQSGETFEVYKNPTSPQSMEIFSLLGTNQLTVDIKNKNINKLNIPANIKDGKYKMMFRYEEIEIAKDGIEAKIINSTFYNGNQKLAECRLPNNEIINILIPIELEDDFNFIPVNPKFFNI